MTEGTVPLRSALAGGVLTLTLDRPEKRNALSLGLVEALHAALELADLDAEARVVVLRGAGKDFCAGADLDELLASADLTLAENEATALRLGALFGRMRALPKPVIAVVHGRALAGGAGLVTACDIAVAGAGAQLGYPEIQRGFVPAMVMTLLRRAAGEKAALDLVLTGRLLGAEEARATGLVSRVVPDAELDREAGGTRRGACRREPLRPRAHQAALLPAGRPVGGRWRGARRADQRARPADTRLPGRHRAVSQALRRGEGRRAVTYLRLGLAFGGFAVALLAVAFEDQRLGWGAIALLAGSLLVRVIERRGRSRADRTRGRWPTGGVIAVARCDAPHMARSPSQLVWPRPVGWTGERAGIGPGAPLHGNQTEGGAVCGYRRPWRRWPLGCS